MPEIVPPNPLDMHNEWVDTEVERCHAKARQGFKKMKYVIVLIGITLVLSLVGIIPSGWALLPVLPLGIASIALGGDTDKALARSAGILDTSLHLHRSFHLAASSVQAQYDAALPPVEPDRD